MRDSLLKEAKISDKEIERNQIKVIKALRDPSNKQCLRAYFKKGINEGDEDRYCFIEVER